MPTRRTPPGRRPDRASLQSRSVRAFPSDPRERGADPASGIVEPGEAGWEPVTRDGYRGRSGDDRWRADRSDRSGSGRVDARDRAASARRAASAPATVTAERVYLTLLPLRLFLGGMLLYAGIDKLLDPTFLHSAGAGSIGQQLQGFTHASPVAGLITAFALPHPVLIGLLVAVAEIAIGLGALTGLAYRAAAFGGFAISVLFFLTASWDTHPIYLGPDLPYAAGWLTLALAGHGGLYTIESWLDGLAGGAYALDDVSPSRRLFLQAAAVGVVSVGLGGMFGVVGKVLHRGLDDEGGATGVVAGATQLPGATAAPGATAPTGSTAAPSSAQGSLPPNTLARLADLKTGTGYQFQDPTTGDPAVLIRLSSSHVVAYDAVCTHQGCTVGYDPSSGLLLCPCHGAAFDPNHGAEVVGGPAPAPLTNLPLRIDPTTGAITLKS